MVTVPPLIETFVLSLALIVSTTVAPFMIEIVPEPAVTVLLNVMTMLSVPATPLALLDGDEDAIIGASPSTL